MMEEKQALQEQITAAEQSQTHNAALASRMEELRAWMERLEVNQAYSDEQTRMAVERITVGGRGNHPHPVPVSGDRDGEETVI